MMHFKPLNQDHPDPLLLLHFKRSTFALCRSLQCKHSAISSWRRSTDASVFDVGHIWPNLLNGDFETLLLANTAKAPSIGAVAKRVMCLCVERACCGHGGHVLLRGRGLIKHRGGSPEAPLWPFDRSGTGLLHRSCALALRTARCCTDRRQRHQKLQRFGCRRATTEQVDKRLYMFQRVP